MKKTALITGATSGIGRSLVEIHAKNNKDLVIVARNKEELLAVKKELEEKYHIDVFIIQKDLAVKNSAKEIYDEIKSQGIEIFYLVNNAGFGLGGYFYNQNEETINDMIAVNISALTNLTRLFIPDFVKRGSGKILNVSSTASLLPAGPMQTVYFATKSYVTSFSYGIASELKGTGVSVTTLLPGAINTNFSKRAGMQSAKIFKKTYPAKQVAKKGYKAMINKKQSVLAGVNFTQRALFKMIPFIPKNILISSIKYLQKTKD